jgi:translation initiation factor 3 subunit B
MAPSFDSRPPDVEFDENDEELNALHEQYSVKLEEGLDTFVVLDGLPKVPEDSKDKLIKFVMRKLKQVGKVREDTVYMPIADDGNTEGRVLR